VSDSRRRAVVLLSILASCLITSLCRAGELTLVSDGVAKAAIIVGDKSAPPENKIAEVLAARIARRTACRLPIRGARDVSDEKSAEEVNIVIGTPTGNSLVGRLCRKFNLDAPALENVGPSGFAVYALREGGRGWIIVSGSDSRGTICGVGKLLRRIDFTESGASLPTMNQVEKIDPDQLMLVQQQKPPQWGNAFMDAPAELLREYIEDMALWGSTDFVTLGFLWTLNNPFDEEADAESREKLKKITDLAVYAGQLGMKIGYYVYPNTVYRDEVGLRELGGKFRYQQDACPSVPEVRKVLLEDRENIFRNAKQSGVELAYTINSAYDFGGCDCPKCEPWIPTHIELSKEVHAIAQKYFPKIKVFFTTWGYTPAEQKMLLEWLEREKPTWVEGVINRPALALPAPYVSVGWQTIFACGPREVYGQMGSDPLPLFLPGKLKEFHDNGVRYIHTYSEGIWDDINNAIVVRACRKPLDADVRETLAEYCHDRFGADWKDSAALAETILADFRHAKSWRFNASLRVESPERVLAQLEEIERRLPPWGKEDWRWGVFKVRVQLEVLDQKGSWLPELNRLLADALAGGDDAKLATAVDRSIAHLRTVEAVSPQESRRWEEQTARISAYLYNDLYQTPHRYEAQGMFRLQPKMISLIPLVIQRLEQAKGMAKPDQTRESIRVLLDEFKLLDRYASSIESGKTIFRPKGVATISAAKFVGGKAVPASPSAAALPSFLKGGARAIGAASGKFDVLCCRFQFETGEKPLAKPVKLTIAGSDRSASGATIAIRLNGRTLFSGPNRFGKDAFSKVSYSVPPDWILQGTNELEIQNLAPSGNPELWIESVTLDGS